MAVNAIGYLCEAADHHADLTVTFAKLWVKLQTHDTAATPFQRLLDQHADHLDRHDKTRLEALHTATDLIALRHRIADTQGNLIELARRRGQVQKKAKTHAVYLSRRKMTPTKRAKPDEATKPATRAS